MFLLAAMPGSVPRLGEGCPDMALGCWGTLAKDLAGLGGEKGKEKSPKSAGGSSQGGNDVALTVIAVAASWGRRLLAKPQEGVRVCRREMRTRPLPQEELQALGEPGEEQSRWDKGSRVLWEGWG